MMFGKINTLKSKDVKFFGLFGICKSGKNKFESQSEKNQQEGLKTTVMVGKICVGNTCMLETTFETLIIFLIFAFSVRVRRRSKYNYGF